VLGAGIWRMNELPAPEAKGIVNFGGMLEASISTLRADCDGGENPGHTRQNAGLTHDSGLNRC
jgi:hypothetical protein